jgi:neurotransmitter:Na+ symporter, NSS family
MTKVEGWGTRLGVILAVSGSAVGLGNFLRFPGQAAANGGGAFLIPYFCALLFLGIPIGWAEWTMARYGGRKGLHSGPAIMGVIGKGSVARYLGVFSILIPLAVSFYYVFVEAWCLGYAWQYFSAAFGFSNGIGIDPNAAIAEQTRVASEFNNQFIGANENGAAFGNSQRTVVFWMIVFALNIFLVYRGISKGIEKFCSFAMPAMAVCAIIVLIRVLTLGTPDPNLPDQNVVNGLGRMWNADFSKLANAQTWLAAAGQIFFSLSVGFGVILNYASYLKKKDDVALSGLTASATNELFEVGFGGMITLTAAYVFLGTSMVIGGTFSLGFTTLPVVFAHMGPAGNFIGGIWFFMLFLAAITSSISMYQPTIAFFEESLGISKKRATTLLVTVCAIGSYLVMYNTKDGEFMTAIDDWVGTFLIFVLAAVQIICFSWIFGIDRGWRELHLGASIRIPVIFKFVMKWVAPAYLLIVFAFFCMNNLFDSTNEETGVVTRGWITHVAESPPRQAAMALVAGVCLFLVGCIWVGEKRWRRDGLDIDDNKPLKD